MADLEQRLREALTYRGEQVTRDTLRQSQLRPQRRRPTRVVAAVAAVACVLAIAGAGLITRAVTAHHPTARADSGRFYIGNFYRAVTVQHGGRTVTIPPSIQAGVQFMANGTLYVDDSVNYAVGRFTPVDGGFTTKRGTLVSTTVATRIDGDPTVAAVMAALGAINSPGPAPVTKTSVSGTKTNLILTVGGYTTTLRPTATPNDPRAKAITLPFYSGNYRLTAVGHRGTTVSVPASIHASIDFLPGNKLILFDSVNGSNGLIEIVAGGFITRTETFVTTAVGYGGHDPVRLEVIDAMGAILGINTPTVMVAVTGTEKNITLAVGGYTLIL